MISPAFRKAERARQTRRPATAAQKRRIAALAREAGIETPHVFWRDDASTVIDRLERFVRQPTLGPM